MKKVLVVLMTIGLVGSAAGATIYVPADQPSIQAALTASTAGDTIMVMPGTYAEMLTYPSHRVTVLSLGGPDVTFLTKPLTDKTVQLQNPDLMTFGDTSALVTDAVSFFVYVPNADSGSSFEGFTIRDQSDVPYVIYVEAASYFEVGNNRFIDNSVGDVIRGLDEASLVMSRNLLSNTTNANAVVTTGPNCSFINNTVDGGPRGLAIYGPYSTVLNNIVVNVDWYSIWNPSPTTTVDYNDFWNNGDNGNPGANGFSLDPLFAAPGLTDYNLQALSPCIDAGHPDVAYNDIDGSRNDMGAFSTALPGIHPVDPHIDSENNSNVLNHTPTIAWTYYDPEGGSQAAFEVEVGTDADFTVAEMWATGEVVSSETFVTYAGLPLEDGESYFVRVRVSNGEVWGEWITFVFRMNSLPSAPTPAFPISGTLVHPDQTYLRVENSTDMENDPVTYDFEVYGDAALTDLITAQYGIAEQTDQTSSGLVEGLQGETEYWWRARAYDSYELSDWSGSAMFLTRTADATVINVPAQSPTIQEALDASVHGDTILVAPGTYTEVLTYPTHRVTVLSSDGAETTFLNSPATDSPVAIQAPGSAGYSDTASLMTDGVYILIHVVEADSGSSFEGFTIQNESGGTYLVLVESASFFEVANNRFIDNNIDDAIRGWNLASLVMTRNLISNSALENAVVTTGPNCSFINNTVDGGARGLAIYGENSTVLNNIVVNVDWYSIWNPSPTTVVDYNDFWNNGVNGDPGLNGISQDPLFMDPSVDDYHLQSYSPCINAGHPDPVYNDPDGSRADMGAYPGQLVLQVRDIHVVSEDQAHVLGHTPTIAWTYLDPEGNPQAAFEVEIGTDNDWAVAEMWATGEVVSDENYIIYSGAPLEDAATYFVRVRVSNGLEWSLWSYSSFRMNSIPTVPVPVYPISGATVHYEVVYLQVANSSDLQSDALTYDFELYADVALTDLVAAEYDVVEQVDQTVSSLIDDLEQDKQYWWRARAKDGYEYSDWAAAETFITRGVGTIRVPEDFATIQQAINAAQDGDVILVSPGTYYEAINYGGRNITIVSTDGRDVTVIQPVATDAPPDIPADVDSSAIMSTDGVPTVSFTSGEGEGAVLDGFTIHNPSGLGIFCSASSPTIQNCDISECTNGTDGAGIWCENSNARIFYNLLHDNYSGKTSAGVGGKGTPSPEIAYNTIYNNFAANGSGIGFVLPTAYVNIHHNVLRNNASPPARLGAIYINGTYSQIINNTVVSNATSGISILGGTEIRIFNNIVVFNTEGGVSGGNSIVDYNDVWSNDFANDPGPNGISADPLFSDPADYDYSLSPTSPCIDAGNPDPIYNDPDGTRNDMGAIFEISGMRPTSIHMVSEDIKHVVNHTPTIAWTFYDPEGGTQVALEIEIGTDDEWSVAEMWATGEIVSSECSIAYAGAALTDGQTYFLRMRVSNGIEWSAWQVVTFRMNSIPSVPVPDYPISQTAVRYTLVYLRVINAGDPETDALKYDFEVYGDAALTQLVAVVSGVDEQPDRTSTDIINGFEEEKEYWWRSRAHDGYECSDWSTVESFLTEDINTIRVPGDFLTIQQAIDVAAEGDLILVDPGVYLELINFLGKNVTVTSTQGRDVTFIQSATTDLPPEIHPVADSGTVMSTDGPPTVSFVSGEGSGSVLDGFTIRNPLGRGILCYHSSPIIQNCDISECYNSGDGAGIWCEESAAIIRGNLIHDNVGTVTGAGVAGRGLKAPEIYSNEIYDNQAPHGAGIGFISPTANVSIHHNLVRNNIGEPTGQAALYVNGTASSIINNTVCANTNGISVLSGIGVLVLNNIAASNAFDGIIPSLATVDYNDIWGNSVNLLTGPNDISADPLFLDPANHNYQLTELSPCINAGHPDPVYNDPDGSRNDMGMYWFSTSRTIIGSVLCGGVGLLGVAVDLFGPEGGLLAGTVTDDAGAYSFEGLAAGIYTVSVLSPLGFFALQESQVVELDQAETEVNFDLIARELTSSQRTRGFWAHQVAVAMSEPEGTQEYRDELCDLLQKIRAHFNDNRVNPITAYEVTAEATCDERLQELSDAIAPRVGEGFTHSAVAHFAALLLNVASDKLGQWIVVSEDAASVSQAITYCDILLTDDNPANDSLAQTIAETINKGQIIPWGLIDLSTPAVMYKDLDTDGLPREFELSQNYPNPFNPRTAIKFALPEPAQVRLEIFNVLGQRVGRLVDEYLQAGYYTVAFDGDRFASGIYFYRLHAGDFVMSKKMILLK